MKNRRDNAMLVLARMQIILERNEKNFNDDRIIHASNSDVLRECLDIIKKANIPKKYLLAESLDDGDDK